MKTLTIIAISAFVGMMIQTLAFILSNEMFDELTEQRINYKMNKIEENIKINSL